MKVKIIPIGKKYEDEFSDAFNKIYFDSKEEARQHFRKYLDSGRLFLLFVNSQLAGFFNYNYLYSHYANYLEDICVAKKFRGQDYSNLLLKKYIEISKDQITKNTIALSSTHKTNLISQKMHETFGFKKIGILKGLHYGEDEIFYAYKIK